MKYLILAVIFLAGCTTAPTEFYTVASGTIYNNMVDQDGNVVATNKKGSDNWEYHLPVDDRCIVDGEVYCEGELIK